MDFAIQKTPLNSIALTSKLLVREKTCVLLMYYREMISEDKAACLLYIRVRHNDPKEAFVLASIVGTVYLPAQIEPTYLGYTVVLKSGESPNWGSIRCVIRYKSDAQSLYCTGGDCNSTRSCALGVPGKTH